MPNSIFQYFSSPMTVRRVVIIALAIVFTALVAAFLYAYVTVVTRVHAAGGIIEVVETDEEVDFPGTLGISLTAQGDADIVDVRLFYRTVGSRYWAYAYPDFVPANKITARLNLTGEVSTYLPPGTEVEYYYEIRDSLGNLLRTEPAVVEYEDTRFDWEEITAGPLTLLYYDQPDTRVRAVVRSVESDLERLQELLQIEQAEEIKGVIYRKASDTLDAFPQQSRTTTDQQTFQGFAFPERRLFLGLGIDRGLIVHEAAHLLFAQAIGGSALPLPSWLDEGFASYMDPSTKVFSGESLADRSNSLRAMSTLTGTPHAIGTHYQKSLSVVAFVIEEFGEDEFQRFVAQLRAGETIDSSLVNVYGFDIDGLDARWAGEASGAPAPAPGTPGPRNPSLFLFLDSWLLGGLVLLAMGAVFIQYVASKLRPARNPKERLQPWEGSGRWEDDSDDGDDLYLR